MRVNLPAGRELLGRGDDRATRHLRQRITDDLRLEGHDRRSELVGQVENRHTARLHRDIARATDHPPLPGLGPRPLQLDHGRRYGGFRFDVLAEKGRENMRAFLALKISEEIESEALKASLELQQRQFEGSWVKSGNFHLTLLFLGERTPDEIQRLSGLLEKNLQFAPFALETDRLGFFKKGGKPTVCWLGIKKHGAFSALADVLTRLLLPLQTDPIDSESAHITLGRLKKVPDQWHAFIRQIEIPSMIFTVRHVFLFKSVLTPQGPVYTCLGKYNKNEGA